MAFISGQGIYLSAYAGASPDQLTAADTAAVALSSTAPIIFVDANFSLGMNYTLSSTLVAVGGILTTGSNSLSCPFARGNEPLFDHGGTGAITFTAPSDWIDGILFNPPTNGTTDCISDFNRWAASCSLPGAMFRWPRGNYHADITNGGTANKFFFPTNSSAQIDATGVVLDSTFVYQGLFQTYLGCPSVGGQVQLTLSNIVSSFTAGSPITIGSITSGVVLNWSSPVLTVGGFTSFTSTRLAINDTITQGGAQGKITAIAYMTACGTETGHAGSTAFVQYSTYAPCFAANCVYGHAIGITGTNTNGASAPSFALQTALSHQDCHYAAWYASANGKYGICIDCSSPSSFSNDNWYQNLTAAFNASQALIVNTGAVENTFANLDFENNGGSSVLTINTPNNVIVGGLLDGGSSPTINYTSTATELIVLATRLTTAPTANFSLPVGNISQANPGVLTYTGATNPANGDMFVISGVVGMTQANGLFVVVSGVNTGALTFNLTDIHGNNIDTTGFSAYTSGGVAQRGMSFVALMRQAGFTGYNNLSTLDSIAVGGHTFLKRAGLSDYPSASVTFVLGSGGTTGHTLSIDTTGFGNGNTGPLHITAAVNDGFGTSHLGGFNFTCLYWRSNSAALQVIAPSLTGLGMGTVTITSVAAASNAVVITFDTSSAILNCTPFVNYGDRLGKDLGS